MPNNEEIKELVIKARLDLAELKKATGEMHREIGSMSKSIQSEIRESNASIALLGEEIGIRLPRHVRTFVSELPGVASAMSAAFNTVAVIAIISVIVEAGKKVEEFVEKNREAAEKLKQAQEGFGQTVQKTFNGYEEKLLQAGIKSDELREDHLDALHKQLTLIDMQGFDQLEGAFKSLESAADKTFESIKSNWLSVITEFSFNQSSGFKGSLQRFGSEYSSLLLQGKGDEAQELLNATQKREEQNRADIIAVRNAGIRSFAHSGLQITGSDTDLALTRLRKEGITDFTDETYNAATQTTGILEAQQRIAAYQRTLTAADKGNAKGSFDKDADERLLTALKEQLSDLESSGAIISDADKAQFWRSILSSLVTDSRLHRQIQDAYNQANAVVTRQIADNMRKSNESFWNSVPRGQAQQNDQFWIDFAETVKEARIALADALETAKTTVSSGKSAIEYNLQRGNIGQQDAAFALADLHAKEYAATIAALDKAQSQGVDVTRLRTAAEAAYTKQQMSDSLAAESAFDKLFDHIRQGAQDVQQKVAAIMEHAVDGLNDEFVNAIFGDKTNFGRVFEDSSKSLLKTGLQYLEGSLLGKGKNKTPQQTFSDAVDKFAKAVDGVGSGSGSASTAQSIASHIPFVTGIEDKIKSSGVGQWLQQNGGKYLPGAMQSLGGLFSMFQGSQHYKGEGSGVANALAKANHDQNKWSRILGGLGGITSGIGSAMFAGAGGLAGLNDSDAAGQLFGGRLFGPGGIFDNLPGFASGGDVMGGRPIKVGELGPELFVPHTSGRIVPNNQLSGGGGPTYIIDAKGTDPALTQANVARAIAASNAHAVHQAQMRMIDRQRRVPSR